MNKTQIEVVNTFINNAAVCCASGLAIPLKSHVEKTEDGPCLKVLIATAQIQPGWKTSEPPKDGTRIVAIGQVNGHDDYGGFAEPFLQTIHWQKTDSGFEGWMRGDLALVTCLEDHVKIHFWIEFPTEAA